MTAAVGAATPVTATAGSEAVAVTGVGWCWWGQRDTGAGRTASTWAEPAGPNADG